MVKVMADGAGLEERDRVVLECAAAHGFVAPGHVVELLEVDWREAEGALAGLARVGLLVRDRIVSERQDVWRITAAGLEEVSSALPLPGLEVSFARAVWGGWLWVNARRGRFGAVQGLLSEREMRAMDRVEGAGGPFAVEPHEFGGGFELHYPALMVLTARRRLALEVVSTAPDVQQLAAVLRAYAADHRVGGVVYFSDDPRLGHVVESVAASVEVAAMVGVRSFLVGGSPE